jgi:hypothetical protein
MRLQILECPVLQVWICENELRIDHLICHTVRHTKTDLDMMANYSHGPSHGNEYTVNFDDAVRQIQVNENKLTKASLLCCTYNMSEVGIGTRLRDGVKQDIVIPSECRGMINLDPELVHDTHSST